MRRHSDGKLDLQIRTGCFRDRPSLTGRLTTTRQHLDRHQHLMRPHLYLRLSTTKIAGTRHQQPVEARTIRRGRRMLKTARQSHRWARSARTLEHRGSEAVHSHLQAYLRRTERPRPGFAMRSWTCGSQDMISDARDNEGASAGMKKSMTCGISAPRRRR